MANIKMLTGAVLGTLLGTLAVAFYPKRQEIFDAIADQSEGLTDKAREYANNLIDKGRSLSKLRIQEEDDTIVEWKSGLAGVLLGAAAALFLAPKTGRQLRSQAFRVYNDLFGKTQEVIKVFTNNAHPFLTRARHEIIHTDSHHPIKKAKRVLKTIKTKMDK